MKWMILAAAAFATMATASAAQAQEPETTHPSTCPQRRVAGETVSACADGLYTRALLSADTSIYYKIETSADIRTCRTASDLGPRTVQCANGAFEWRHRRTGRLVLAKVRAVLDPNEVDYLLVRNQNQDNYYRQDLYPATYGPGPRFGEEVAQECFVLGNMNSTPCLAQFQERDNGRGCRGLYSGRYVEPSTCERWRRQAEGD